MGMEQGVFTYACPMPPQGYYPQPWIPYPYVPWIPPCPVPVEPQKYGDPESVPTDWAGPSIEQDLHEAERLFEIAVKRVRAAIAKHRAQEGT